MKKERCAFCGQPATLLCDFVLGFEIKGWTMCNAQAAFNADRFEEFVPGKGLPYGNMDSACFTCDAPLCEACAHHHGLIFFDGDKKHTAIDSRDTCPLHPKEMSPRAPVITAETAEKIRLQLWKLHIARVGEIEQPRLF
jgi:hypothetical protein